MAQQQGLAFPSGAEAQEWLASPAEPARAPQTHSERADGQSSQKAFAQLRRFSKEQQNQKAVQVGGVTSRQALFPAQVDAAHRVIILYACPLHASVLRCISWLFRLGIWLKSVFLKQQAVVQRAKDGESGKGAPGDDVKIVHLDKELTLEERQLIVKHALDTEDQDAEGLLNRIRARMERYVL